MVSTRFSCASSYIEITTLYYACYNYGKLIVAQFCSKVVFHQARDSLLLPLQRSGLHYSLMFSSRYLTLVGCCCNKPHFVAVLPSNLLWSSCFTAYFTFVFAFLFAIYPTSEAVSCFLPIESSPFFLPIIRLLGKLISLFLL